LTYDHPLAFKPNQLLSKGIKYCPASTTDTINGCE